MTVSWTCSNLAAAQISLGDSCQASAIYESFTSSNLTKANI
jgi:hypothetical protein